MRDPVTYLHTTGTDLRTTVMTRLRLWVRRLFRLMIRAFESHGYDWAKQANDEGFDYIIAFDGHFSHSL